MRRRYFFSLILSCTVLTGIAITRDNPPTILLMPHQPVQQWAPRQHIPLSHQRIRYQSQLWQTVHRVPERRSLQFSLNRT